MAEGFPGTQTRKAHWSHKAIVPALLAVSAVLAVTSLIGDSITFDETSHLTAGMSYLKMGDFRLAPDHPPLAKVWCALPLLFVRNVWPPADDPDWCHNLMFVIGRRWLFELNDGQRLLVAARCMMVVLLSATCLVTYALARRLFGPAAALLALALAALSPTLLAHGRLVTTDLPITLVTAVTILTYARFLERSTWLRLLGAALALAAASVTKMSWPLVVPALVVMGVVHVLRPGVPGGRGRRGRVAVVLGSGVLMAVVTCLGIWTCYGWRSSIVPPLAANADATTRANYEQIMTELGFWWQDALAEPPDGSPPRGALPDLLHACAVHKVLPEAYLLGLTMTVQATSGRSAYLMGRYSNTGWRAYFPVAFAIKTPLPTLGLLLAGLAALAWRKTRIADGTLLVGLAAFALLYAGQAVYSAINIGHRHLLPVYPALFVVGGGACGWLTGRAGRWLVGAALVWLAAANLWIHPHYLAYFNESIGGPARGHLYLADSNIDWGQDLLRLGRYARQHPEEPLKLAYFGSALPTWYVPCTALPSYFEFDPRAALTAGTYVVSVTQLLGVYDLYVRDEFWNAATIRTYALLRQRATAGAKVNESPEQRAQRERLTGQYEEMRARLLINRLRHRPPDDRIGYSLWVYRLTEDEIERLIQPPSIPPAADQ